MKRILIASALILATVGGASAMTSGHNGLTAIQSAEVQARLPGADLSNLSNAQTAAIGFILSGDDNGRAQSLRSVLAWN
ncbi:MAG: hypothetical protein U1D35_14575 [Paracoccaceae bacterium]|nr:hypothetical protein [Paracoccaceae bacterium]